MSPYERLEFVRDVVLSLPADQVRMEVWITHLDPNGCGTVGCAIGHAALRPEMQAEGLSIRPLRDYAGAYRPFVHGTAVGCNSPELAAFFGITEKRCTGLFISRRWDGKPRTRSDFLRDCGVALRAHRGRPA